jgi:hypothetical protein
MTTRRYPRSLAEAFPDVRAACVEIYRPASHSLRGVFLAAAIGVVIAAVLFFGLSS